MKLREAKRLVKATAITTYERVYPPVYYVTMMMRFHNIELRATGVAICQPEDEWRPVVGAGIARGKAIAQLAQQVVTLDGIERKRAEMAETEKFIDETLEGMTRRHEAASTDNVHQFVVKYFEDHPEMLGAYCQNRDEANQRVRQLMHSERRRRAVPWNNQLAAFVGVEPQEE